MSDIKRPSRPLHRWRRALIESDLPSRARLVGFVLAEYMATDELTCFPGISTIALKANLNRRTVMRGLEDLEKAGFLIRRPGRKGYATRYEGVIPPSALSAQPPSALDTPPADELWDAVARVFGPVAVDTNADGKRKKAVADLKRLDATPDSIEQAVARWSRLYPSATLTDTALSTHYPQLVLGIAERIEPCSECGVGAGMHTDDCGALKSPTSAPVSPTSALESRSGALESPELGRTLPRTPPVTLTPLRGNERQHVLSNAYKGGRLTEIEYRQELALERLMARANDVPSTLASLEARRKRLLGGATAAAMRAA